MGSAILLLLLSVTEIVIWWPGVRHWEPALTVDFRRNWRRINYDTHSAVGSWTLLIVSFWGRAQFILPGHGRFQFVNSLSPIITARPSAVAVTPDPDASKPDLASLVSFASTIDPATWLSGVTFVRPPGTA